MTPILVQGPAVEPVTAAAMRAYLRLDDGTEDALLASLVAAARLRVEALSGRVLLASRWRVVGDRWPASGVLPLPLAPILAVEAVRVAGTAGPVVLDPALVALLPGDPARLLVDGGRPDPALPVGGIAIDVRAGFGEAPADVPAPLIQAVRLLVAHSFEHRGDEPVPLPPELTALVAPYRRARL